MKTSFTVEEIRKYILSQDSLGDVAYNLSAENIIRANELENKENDEDDYCDDCGCDCENCRCGE